ncbi:hemerythrin domain-containing protein [Streptomyces sp. NPDC001107]
MQTDFALDADGNVTAATMFLMVHHALRRDLERLPKALAALDPKDTRQARLLAEHWQLYRWALMDHSVNEDDILFPLVLERAPQIAPALEAIEQDHEGLEAQLDEVSRLLQDLSTPEAIGVARATAEELEEFLGRHLDAEEEHIVPVLVDRITPGELRERQGQETSDKMKDFEEPPMWLVVTWSEEGVPREVSDAVVAALPPHFRDQMAEAFPQWRAEYADLAAKVWSGVL